MNTVSSELVQRGVPRRRCLTRRDHGSAYPWMDSIRFAVNTATPANAQAAFRMRLEEKSTAALCAEPESPRGESETEPTTTPSPTP